MWKDLCVSYAKLGTVGVGDSSIGQGLGLGLALGEGV